MAQSIRSQAEQYGLPEKEASLMPSKAEVADLLRGPRITPGLMKRASDEEEE